MSELSPDAYEQMVGSADVLFFSVDKNLKYTYINPFFALVHNISQEDVIGMSMSDVIGERGFRQNLEHYQNVLKGQSIKYDSFFIKADGNPHYYNATYIPLKSKEGIIGFTGVVIDSTAEKELDRLSKKDPLTSLGNRREFEADLNECLESSSESSSGLIMVDIDFFKKINDDLGHDQGDYALISVGDILNEKIDLGCQAYRIGGEEFVIICENITGSNKLLEIANYLRKKIESAKIISGRTITVSMGAVIFGSGNCRSKILKEADILLYRSKSNGRNQVSISE